MPNRKDMRVWLDYLEKNGMLKRIKKEVDKDWEIAAFGREVFLRYPKDNRPALLFENVKGSSAPVVIGAIGGSRNIYAAVLGIPSDNMLVNVGKKWADAIQNRIPTKTVAGGPVKENILKGDDVDVFAFPHPFWTHGEDPGYFLTAPIVISKHPVTGQRNVGCYRCQLKEKNKMGIHFSGNFRHMYDHVKANEDLNQPTPVAIAIGGDPTVSLVSVSGIPKGIDEMEVAGGLKGQAIEMVKCETVDLEVPAGAEMVVEGFIDPNPETYDWEGPFGEFTGYYTGVRDKRPVIKVTCITHRNDPILRGALEGSGPGYPNEDNAIYGIISRAIMWDYLELAGIQGVVDVKPGSINVVKIKQTYQAEARQVALALWAGPASEELFKNVMVVNDDIDIYDNGMLNWAWNYRVNPKEDLVIFPGGRGGHLDPSSYPEDRDELKLGTGRWNRLLIDATFDLRQKGFWLGKPTPPLSIDIEPEDRDLVLQRWNEYGFTDDAAKLKVRK